MPPDSSSHPPAARPAAAAAAPRPSSRWRAAAIAAIAFVAFANSLGNYYMVDDYWHLQSAVTRPWPEVFKPFKFGGRGVWAILV